MSLEDFTMNGDDFDKDPELVPDDAVSATDEELSSDSGGRKSAPPQHDAQDDTQDEPGEALRADSDEEEEADGFTHEGEIEYEQDDPLAPGFDLEEGTPLPVGRSRGALPGRAAVKSAKEFFNGEILYRFDILEDEARNELKGKYRIELKGFQGGIWTVDVGDQLEIVNRRDEAEIVLTMQQRDFLQLVNGDLNPQLAVFAQKMRISGDLRKAVAFQALLSPEGE